MEADGVVALPLENNETVQLTSEELIIRLQAKEGYAASQGKNSVVIISTELTDDLIKEGYAREIVRAIQTQRKELNCEYSERIAIDLDTNGETNADDVRHAIEMFREFICAETLCDSLNFVSESLPQSGTVELSLAGASIKFFVKRKS